MGDQVTAYVKRMWRYDRTERRWYARYEAYDMTPEMPVSDEIRNLLMTAGVLIEDPMPDDKGRVIWRFIFENDTWVYYVDRWDAVKNNWIVKWVD